MHRQVKMNLQSRMQKLKSIRDVQELKVKNKLIYLIKVTDISTWRTIRVCNGDHEEIENYSTVISPCR